MTDDQPGTKGKADGFTTLRIGRRALTTITALVGVIIVAGVAFGVGRLTSRHQLNPEVRPVITSVDHWGTLIESLNLGYEDFRPAAVDLPASVSQVATSNSTEYALLTNGTVWAWGFGNYGQLGNDTTDDAPRVPVEVHFPAGVKIASLPTDAMPFNTALALDTSGQAWGWGMDSDGQLCQGNRHAYPAPVAIALPDVTVLSGAGDHALYDSDGTVYACGVNGYGDLGDGTMTPSFTPVVVSDLAGDPIKALVSSDVGSGALLADGAYYDWGYNAQGQLGDGTVLSSSVPVHVHLPYPVTQVVQGGSDLDNGSTLAMLSDGSLYAWGYNGYGELGTRKVTAPALSPLTFAPPTGVTYVELATGGQTSYAVSSTGLLYAWGAGAAYEIGNGEKAKAVVIPTAVETGVTDVSSTAFGVASS